VGKSPGLRRAALPVRSSSGPRSGRRQSSTPQATEWCMVAHASARPVLIDQSVREELAGLSDLDPEHMHATLAGIDAVSGDSSAGCGVRHRVHATLPEAAAGYGLPFEWTERWGVRRFGFQGFIVAYAVERTSELLGTSPSRLIICHLGGGCSVTAVEDGRRSTSPWGSLRSRV